ncbi:MAG: NADH:flavin oxidoreductase, partial [Thermodesulfobacteriota bacterium]|nr:NADH:flavin oxidoreductase [Thermodesulfobacteriota bacterium]
RIGNMEIKNRFVHSATYEGMALETGEVTDRLIKRYHTLARGEVGLIITGLMSVQPLGRGWKYQTGIHSDDMIPGLKRLVESVHKEGGKITFQLAHAGRQSSKEVISETPMGPSSKVRDPVYFFKPRAMTETEIQETIGAFGAAARRAAEAGADAIQLHAAHGYLISQFLSPFFNRRKDAWGGSDENRFRLLKEIILKIRDTVPEGIPVLVKMNANDFTPREGITPPLAVKYAGWLADLEIDALEVSCGTLFSYMNMCRGDVPVNEMVHSLPAWKKPVGRIVVGRLVGKYELEEGYNLEGAKVIKPVIGNMPLILVGGLRRTAHMEEILQKNYADLISMCRPFIREPLIVKKFREGKVDTASCVSCNRCLAGINSNLPTLCYHKGFPAAK